MTTTHTLRYCAALLALAMFSIPACTTTPADDEDQTNDLNAGTGMPGAGQGAGTGAGINAAGTGAGAPAAGAAGMAGGTAGTAAGAAGTAAGAMAGAGAAGAAGATAGTGNAGTEAMAGAAGVGGDAGNAGSGPATEAACDGQTLLALDPDTSVPGPWPVGVKTVNVSVGTGSIKVEVWYPATIGSEAGMPKVSYDGRDWLPPAERSKVSDAVAIQHPCECYRDLPLDTTHGPYPVFIFIHGTGAFRTASRTMMAHAASRGFVAVAADHPGLFLTDQLGCGGGSGILQNLNRDMDAIFDGLTNKTGELAFLGDRVDMTRVAVGGHSQGAGAAYDNILRPGVRLILPYALYGSSRSGGNYEAVMFVSGMSDSITPFSGSRDAYSIATVKKRIVGITGGQHLDVTDLCEENSQGQSGIEVANSSGVCGTGLLTILAQCGTIDRELGPAITNYATSAQLEETLQCRDRTAAFEMLEAKFPAVGEFQQQ